jgi:MFS family permease
MSRNYSDRKRTLWLVGTLHAFTHLYQVALLPLYFPIQQDLRLGSIEQATLLVTVLGIAYFLPSYPLGALADRLSRKKLLTLGLIINALGFLGLSFAPNYSWALLGAALAGFGGSFYHPSATALIASLFPESKGRALGLVGIGASIGFFAGPMYTGWRVVSASSWRTPVFELGALGLVAAAVFAWLADDERSLTKGDQPALEKGIQGAPIGSASEKLFPTRTLWTFFFGASIALSLRDFAGSAMGTSASLYLQSAHGFSPKLTGVALSGIYISSVISNPLFGRLSDSARMRWVAFVLIMAAAMMSAFPRVPVSWMAPVLLAYGFFFMASYPITEAALMESVPDSVRGRVFGLFITIAGFVGNLSHWLIGSWIHQLGPRASLAQSYLPLYGLLSVMVVASVSALPMLNAIRKREHLPPTPEQVAQFSGMQSPGAQ